MSGEGESDGAPEGTTEEVQFGRVHGRERGDVFVCGYAVEGKAGFGRGGGGG